MIASSLMLAAVMAAQGYEGPDPARLLLLAADSCAFAISMKPLAADAAEVARFEDDRKKALSSVVQDGPAALKFSGNSPEVQAAIKDFYTVAESFCKNPTGGGKAEFQAKENVLDKLLEAAGR